MNCANHPDIERVAFCRTCGKPLCANCTREVKGVIYCENCIAERLQGVTPPLTGYQQIVDPAGGVRVQPVSGSGPHPPVAGILAGFFPFGVGAVYTGQYAKGLAHLVIFVLLIVGMGQSDPLDTICGLGFAFFYVYQIIDAVRSARAIQAGLPAPDPFGLAQAFGAAPTTVQASTPTGAVPVVERSESRIPSAAILLIGLGLLFLLQTAGVFEFNVDHLFPLILVGIGLWLLAKRFGYIGPSYDKYGRSYRIRGLTGPAVLITLGLLLFVGHLDRGPGFHRTWPLLLLVIGLARLFDRGAAFSSPPPTAGLPPLPVPPGISGPPGTGMVNPPGTPATSTQNPSNEVHNG
jgi:hypothetical protein